MQKSNDENYVALCLAATSFLWTTENQPECHGYIPYEIIAS